jgi:hypothetical protein
MVSLDGSKVWHQHCVAVRAEVFGHFGHDIVAIIGCETHNKTVLNTQ